MLIKQATLVNFQCHKHRVIPFGRVTSIVGETDTGKSAIIRAIRWLALNQGNATSLMANGKSSMSVAFELDSGVVVKRARSKKKNVYRIDDATFHAVGSKVPDDVSALLPMTELNFQTQFDQFFWIGLSPVEIARRLNELVDIDYLDKLQRLIASGLRTSQADARASRRRLPELRNRLNSLAWLNDAENALNALKAEEKRISAITAQIALCRTVRKTREIERFLRKSTAKLRIRALAVDSLRLKRRDVQTGLFGLMSSRSRIEALTSDATTTRTQLNEATKLLKKAEANRCPTCKRPR